MSGTKSTLVTVFDKVAHFSDCASSSESPGSSESLDCSSEPVIFPPLEETLVDGEYECHRSIMDLDVLGLITFCTDKAYLGEF